VGSLPAKTPSQPEVSSSGSSTHLPTHSLDDLAIEPADRPFRAMQLQKKGKRPNFYERVHALKEERHAAERERARAKPDKGLSGAEKALKERMLLNGKRLLPSRSYQNQKGQDASATLSHLQTPFIDATMRARDTISAGVEARFFKPTNNPPQEDGQPLRREISQEQAEHYESLKNQVIDIEKEHSGTHIPLYHAQDPRIRVAQDVYKRVYAKHYGKELEQNFHFMRFKGPQENEYRDTLPQFFKKDMEANGMIDDNIPETKSKIASVNLSAFGGLGHPGEETFHYFQIGKGQTPLPITQIMQGYLDKFGLDGSGAGDLYEQAQALNDTKEGSLLQILVPKDKVDDVAYAAHPHGLPHDDHIIDRLHEMGPIKYRNNPEGEISREKMNDELTRKLANIRDVWRRKDEIPEPSSFPREGAVMPRSILSGTNRPYLTRREQEAFDKQNKDREDSLLLSQAKVLHRETLDKFTNSKTYSLSAIHDDYVRKPAKLQHREGKMQAARLASNPDHFGGQGVRSHHETMRIQNRSNYLQARLHMSDQGMLNPDSGIKVFRHTTVQPQQQEAYDKLLDEYVHNLYQPKAGAQD
jgi:hypothetical protein